MKKRIAYITFSVICMMALSCQKATLVDEMPEECLDINGRNSEETETSSDSITIIPDINTDGWDTPIDVNFGFGDNSNNN